MVLVLYSYLKIFVERGLGKYLDLSSFYEAFVNIKGAPEMDYIDYLSTFYKFELFGNTVRA